MIMLLKAGSLPEVATTNLYLHLLEQFMLVTCTSAKMLLIGSFGFFYGTNLATLPVRVLS